MQDKIIIKEKKKKHKAKRKKKEEESTCIYWLDKNNLWIFMKN